MMSAQDKAQEGKVMRKILVFSKMEIAVITSRDDVIMNARNLDSWGTCHLHHNKQSSHQVGGTNYRDLSDWRGTTCPNFGHKVSGFRTPVPLILQWFHLAPGTCAAPVLRHLCFAFLLISFMLNSMKKPSRHTDKGEAMLKKIPLWMMIMSSIVLCIIMVQRPIRAEMNATSTVLAKGKCLEFTMGAEKYGCDTVIYAHFANGRTSFSIPIPSGAISLSGAHDEQKKATDYLLQIDTLRIGHGSGQSDAINASGTCHMNITPKGDYVRYLKCNVDAGGKKVIVDFKGGETPVEMMAH